MESHSDRSRGRNDGPLDTRTDDGFVPTPINAVNGDGDGDGTSGRGCEVLIVDDNRDAALSLAMILQLWGHSCHVVHNGADAIKVAGGLRPDVVLLDIVLPDTDGSVVASSLRADPRLNEVVIVATTGHASGDEADRARHVGFDHHLLKPLQLDVLQSLLEKTAKAGLESARVIPPGPR